MTLAFDIDGCLANFTKGYAKLLIKVSGVDLFPPNWKGDDDPHFPTTWFWERAMGYGQWEKAVWKEHILVDGKFWEKLPPLPGTPETLARINELAKAGHNIYFVTHRMGVEAKQQTERWLYKYGINYPTVLLSGDKLPLIKSLEVDAFIDDKPSTVNTVAVDNPQRRTFVKDAPYNRGMTPANLDGTPNEAYVVPVAIRVPSVAAMLDHLELLHVA